MSLTQAPLRVAAIEGRRRLATERLVEILSITVLACASLYILTGDSPFERSAIDHSTEVSPVNRWVWLGLLLAAMPLMWLRRRAAVMLAGRSWRMLAVFAWFTLSVSWALDPAASARRMILYWVMLAIFVAVTAGLQRQPAHRVIAICAGLVVLVDLASWPLVPGIAMTELGFAGMHAQKNVTGEIALFAALAAATCLARQPGRGLSAVLWVLLASDIVVLVVSRSATSQSLGVAAVLLIPVLTRVLRGSRARALGMGAVVLLVLAAVPFCYLAWAGIAGVDPIAPLQDITFTERTDLWGFLIDNIRERPLRGAGFGSFWAIDPAVQPSILSGLWFGQAPEIANQGHDAYLDIAATTGLVGLGLALWVLLRAIVLAGAEVARGGSVFPLGFLLILVVHGVTESSLFTANSVFGSFFVLTAVQLEQGRRQAARDGALSSSRARNEKPVRELDSSSAA